MAKRFFFFFFFFVIFCFCFFTFCRLYMRNSIRGKFCSSFRMMAFYGVKRSILQKAQPKWMYFPSKKEIIKMSNSFQSIGAFFLRVFRISNNLPISDSLFFFTTVNFYPWDHCFYMAWAIRLVIRNQNDWWKCSLWALPTSETEPSVHYALNNPLNP